MADRLGPALERAMVAVGARVPPAVSDPIATEAKQRAVQVRELL